MFTMSFNDTWNLHSELKGYLKSTQWATMIPEIYTVRLKDTWNLHSELEGYLKSTQWATMIPEIYTVRLKGTCNLHTTQWAGRITKVCTVSLNDTWKLVQGVSWEWVKWWQWLYHCAWDCTSYFQEHHCKDDGARRTETNNQILIWNIEVVFFISNPRNSGVGRIVYSLNPIFLHVITVD